MGNKQKGVFCISTYSICKADCFEPALFISMFGNVVCFFLSFIDTGLVFLAPIYISSGHEFMHSLYIPILRTLTVIDRLPINCGSATSRTGSTAINAQMCSHKDQLMNLETCYLDLTIFLTFNVLMIANRMNGSLKYFCLTHYSLTMS